MTIANYVPEKFPHQWLPGEARAQDLGADRALVSAAPRPADRLGRGPGALARRGRRAERGGRPGGGRAVHRHDLPDRRPRARGGPPGVRPRHRAEAQAAPERDPRTATSTRRTARGLPRDRYLVFDRALENRRALYREANIPRETELAELEQQYQKIIGAMTVTFQGQGADPGADGPVPGRDRPRAAPGGLGARRRPPAGRPRRARRPVRPDDRAPGRGRAGGGVRQLTSITPSGSRERFDYGVDGRRSGSTRRSSAWSSRWPGSSRRSAARRSGVESLRPWDLAVDPLGPAAAAAVRRRRAAGRGDRGDLPRGRPRARAASSPTCATSGLLDLANRKGKAPGGYQTTLEDDRLPFIFMNAVGPRRRRPDPAPRGGPRLPRPGQPRRAAGRLSREPDRVLRGRLDDAWSCSAPATSTRSTTTADADRSYRQLLEGIVLILPWIATVDAFQHWIYTHPGHTRDERQAAWTALLDRFGGIVDWSGYEEARDHSWHRQLHIFLYPFYYIEYGIAQLGALQIWRRGLTDRAGGRGRLPPRPGAGRLAAPARAVRRGRHPVRLRRGADRPADGRDRRGAGAAGSLKTDGKIVILAG